MRGCDCIRQSGLLSAGFAQCSSLADAGMGCTGQVLTSAAALAAFGILGAVLGGAGVIKGGSRVLIGGLAAMAITYGFGRAFNRGGPALP